jgi:hypothetical protein
MIVMCRVAGCDNEARWHRVSKARGVHLIFCTAHFCEYYCLDPIVTSDHSPFSKARSRASIDSDTIFNSVSSATSLNYKTPSE